MTALSLVFHSAREGRNVWGDCRSPLLQQEQDRGEIPNCQVFLFPWSGCGHHQGHAFLRWWYVHRSEQFMGFLSDRPQIWIFSICVFYRNVSRHGCWMPGAFSGFLLAPNDSVVKWHIDQLLPKTFQCFTELSLPTQDCVSVTIKLLFQVIFPNVFPCNS